MSKQHPKFMLFFFLLKKTNKPLSAELIGQSVSLQSLDRKCWRTKGQEELASIIAWVYLQRAGRGEGRERNGKRRGRGRSEQRKDVERERRVRGGMG